MPSPNALRTVFAGIVAFENFIRVLTSAFGVWVVVFSPEAVASFTTLCNVRLESEAWLDRTAHWYAQRDETSRVLLPIKDSVTYPNVPSVYELRLPQAEPQRISYSKELSPGLVDPLIEEARRLEAFDDFKILSDATPIPLNEAQVEAAIVDARGRASNVNGLARKEFLRALIPQLFHFRSGLRGASELLTSRWSVRTNNNKWNNAFDYTEASLHELLGWTPTEESGSTIASPYPVLIPSAGRFTESYYWDTYFAIKWLLVTRRYELAMMQAENLLSMIRRFGFIPNGMRDYYLSRSQPPFISSMIREIVLAVGLNRRVRRWLKERAYPLVRMDYENFWMNPNARWDRVTGLNHHWDALDFPRPERHARDNDSLLGKTYRDVRAEAESALDFTDAFEGQAGSVAGVLLNSMLYKTERDLLWMANKLGDREGQQLFEERAKARKRNMQRLWNAKAGRFENLNLITNRRVDMLTSDTFFPLWVGVASKQQAAAIMGQLSRLERVGGIMATEHHNPAKQWTGTNGWAVYMFAAVAGARRWGFDRDANRVARKWVDSIATIYALSQGMFERIDVENVGVPEEDALKYPTQKGFLWTNGMYVWALVNVLGQKLHPYGIPH